MKTSMLHTLIALTTLTSSAVAATPEETVPSIRTVKWAEVPLPAGAVLHEGSGESATLLVKHDGSKPLMLPLWKIETPGITKKCYAVRGKVRHKDVTGSGYLELWNVFSAEVAGKPELRAFSRTLAEQGPLSRITGSSDWREVFIPFDATQATQPPKALELNLNLPGSGEVEVSSLELVEFDNAAAMWAAIGSSATTLVTTAASPPGFRWGARNAALAIGALAIIGIGVWFMARKGRHAAEERRMKAMDAMP
jgi:hypothetical protein